MPDSYFFDKELFIWLRTSLFFIELSLKSLFLNEDSILNCYGFEYVSNYIFFWTDDCLLSNNELIFEYESF